MKERNPAEKVSTRNPVQGQTGNRKIRFLYRSDFPVQFSGYAPLSCERAAIQTGNRKTPENFHSLSGWEYHDAR
jgi:hypothetical protein